jgi:ParB-like chromosome segregation protein Spo0J
MAKRATTKTPRLTWIAVDLRPLAVPIERVAPDPDNPRTHEDESVQAIMASLKEFGQLRPIVANRRNKQVVAGNGVYMAALQLGWSHIAVVWVKQDRAAQLGYAIADNRTAEISAWDNETLAAQLLELDMENEQADLFAALQLESLCGVLADDVLPDPSDAAAQVVPESFEVVVQCEDEEAQQVFFEEMRKQGRTCRLLTM